MFTDLQVLYFCSEVERQGDTPKYVYHMAQAYRYLKGLSDLPLLTHHILKLGGLVQGLDDQATWRNVPAYFDGYNFAMAANLIPSAMKTLLENCPTDHEMVDSWIKQFLDIHPFVDGNGRCASLLRNFFMGTLDTPVTLPYYYGEQ